ncbi:hypothetical protein E4G67_00010 [Candidatus Bathyarchaeota archaeon]|nr:MAG: hypothetical protein E4G67_00010 [Candidatus Bathyarchaeota archaeon]
MAFIGIIRPSLIPATGISNLPGASGVPILPIDITPTKEQSAYRITIVASGIVPVLFGMTIDDGITPYTTLFNDGLGLKPDTSYLFTHGVTNKESYNFVLLGGPVGWRKLQVEEVTEGVI